MTRQHDLDIIRAACFNANPDAAKYHTKVGNNPPRYAQLPTSPQYLRLADVLLAIGATQIIAACDDQGNIFEMNLDGRVIAKGAYWNLRDDTLDAQSDATLSFLGGLLG